MMKTIGINSTNRLLCLAIFSIIFLSCESPYSAIDDDDDDIVVPKVPPACVILSPGTQELQPLAVGNYWVYETWYISPNIKSTLREEITNSHEIDCLGGMFTAYSKRAFNHLQNTPRVPGGVEWLSANSDSGLMSIGAMSNSDTTLHVSPMYKHLSGINDKWTVELPSYNAQLDTFTKVVKIEFQLVNTNGIFTTEFGHFEHCYVFRFIEKGDDDAVYTWQHDIFFQQGIGMVGRRTRDILYVEDVNDPNLPIIGEWTLIDYKIE